MSKAGKTLTGKQAAQIKERGDKMKELKTIYAERFAGLPNPPLPKSYNAAALVSAAAGKKAGVTEAQQLEIIIARERAAYNAKQSGTTVKKSRKAAPAALGLSAIPEESTAAVAESAPNAGPNVGLNSALLAVAPKPKKKRGTTTLKAKKMDASALRAEAARVEAELMEQARAARESLLAQAKDAEEKSAARRLAAEATKAARAMAKAAKASATVLESQAKAAVSASLADLEVQAAANLKSVNANTGLAKGLAALRKNGRNITAKNFSNICSHCSGKEHKEHKPRKVRSNKGTKKGPKDKKGSKGSKKANASAANNSK
jgi:hypothetical protein